jgi:hypothetical protein
MGDLIPMRDHAATRDATASAADSPWFKDAPDWDPCHGCPVRGACREVRECQWGAPFDTDPEPAIALRLVEPPDIIA